GPSSKLLKSSPFRATKQPSVKQGAAHEGDREVRRWLGDPRHGGDGSGANSAAKRLLSPESAPLCSCSKQSTVLSCSELPQLSRSQLSQISRSQLSVCSATSGAWPGLRSAPDNHADTFAEEDRRRQEFQKGYGQEFQEGYRQGR